MRQDDETTRSDGQPPERETERPAVILPANELRITEILRHIEAGRIVLIIPPRIKSAARPIKMPPPADDRTGG